MAKKSKETSTALVKWEEELANLAQATTQGAKAGEGKFISFKSGQMSFAGADIEDNELRCVIVGWAYHNAYYDPTEGYDPKNPQSPICYATNTNEDEMQPHADAPDKQCGSCADCPFNEFGSARKGEGKACKNTVRLALIAESDLDDIKNAEVVYASIPPKSLKNWFAYVTKELRDKVKRPHWAVITNMSVVPDSESQFRVLFKNEELIEDSKLFGPLKALWEETLEGIDFPYQQREAAPPAKSKGKKKFSRR